MKDRKLIYFVTPFGGCEDFKVSKMYAIKKEIYLDLTKNQKSALCNYLRALVKKSQELSVYELWEIFVEDENIILNLIVPGLSLLPNCLTLTILEKIH